MSLIYVVLASLLVTSTFACDFHSPPTRRTQEDGNTTIASPVEALDWNYDASFNWARIKPQYKLCQSGTQQSPISLRSLNGTSKKHGPTLTDHGQVEGIFYNWGFGPAFGLDTSDSQGPSISFDNETYHLTGWHIHTPSDHVFDGVHARAEMHMVYVNAQDEVKAVVGIPVHAGDTESAFISQIPSSFPNFNDTETTLPKSIDLSQALDEVENLQNFWTYHGSLTTPPCKEGVRWFVSQDGIHTNTKQMQSILTASSYASRMEQMIWLHNVNM